MTDSKNSQVHGWQSRTGTSLWHQVRHMWRDGQWYVVGAVWLVTLYLGFVGFARHFAALGEVRSPLDLFYLTLQLFPLQSGAVAPPLNWQLQAARLLAPAVAAYTAVRALATLFYERLQSLRLRFMHDHVVICGLGRMGLLLTRGFLARGERLVVIERDDANDYIGPCREQGAIVLVGSATDSELLRKAGVPKARYVISVCGDDSTNAEVAVRVRDLANDPGRMLTCCVHIVDPRLYSLLRERELVLEAGKSFRLEFLNIFDRGAQLLLDEYPILATKAAEKYQPHVLVVGLGRMGESVIAHIARSWWLQGNQNGKRRRPRGMVRPRITVIDLEAQHKVESLCLRYSQLDKVCGLNPCQMDICSPEFERAGFLFTPDGDCDVTAVCVCLDNDSLGLTAGLTLLQHLRGHNVPIVVRLEHETGLATLLRGAEESTFQDLHGFGLLDRTCQPEMILGGTHEILSRAIHEDYVRRQRELGDTPESNPALVPWDELSEDLKESNRQQADHISVKLKAIGYGIAPLTDWDAERLQFTAQEVEQMARMEHQRFVEERLHAGWTYARGPKSMEQKTSPDLVPWDELSESTKEKDRSTVRGLPSFLARAGLQAYRPGRNSGLSIL
jgi:hypothetical protein